MLVRMPTKAKIDGRIFFVRAGSSSIFELASIKFQMVKHFKILILLLMIVFSSFGQVSIPSKVFHQHFQTCEFVGTTEEDFIIILNGDSTINITRYNSNYRDQYNTVTRQTYLGTYSTFGDTIKVKFTDRSLTTKSKIKEINTTHFAKKVDTLLNSCKFFQYPSTIYITSADKIISMDGLFPTLSYSSATDKMQLESKFMNWDRGSFYRKQIFGVFKVVTASSKHLVTVAQP